MNKKGTVTLYLVFIVSSLFILMIAAFFAPIGVRFNTEMYKAGEKIMLQANESVQDIKNETLKASIQSIMDRGLDAVENNIEVNNAFFKYGWILFIGLTALIVFIFTRRLVEFGGGGLV